LPPKVDIQPIIQRHMNVLLRRIGDIAYRKVKPKIKSRTLKKSLRRVLGNNTVTLNIPYYWAAWYHDGTKRKTSTRTGGYLVYFKNVINDPRVKGGYPRTAAQVKKLTKEQFREGLIRNKTLSPEDPRYMVVRKSVGPSPEHPFFRDLDIREEATDAARKEMTRLMRELGLTRTEKVVLRGKL